MVEKIHGQRPFFYKRAKQLSCPSYQTDLSAATTSTASIAMARGGMISQTLDISSRGHFLFNSDLLGSRRFNWAGGEGLTALSRPELAAESLPGRCLDLAFPP